MARKAKDLTAFSVARLNTPGMHFVGEVPGLALQVLRTGGRTWVLRIVIAGKRRDMGLGGYPAVTLAGARDAARVARAKVKQGIDPIEEAKALRSAMEAARASAVTFEECATRYIAAHSPAWKEGSKSEQQWINTLATYAFPVMGSLLVRDVDVPHVLDVVEPIWASKTETASRVRNRIELVLDWATAKKYRSGSNPARWRGHLDKLLPRPSKVSKPEHHRALPLTEISAFMVRLRASSGMGARALEFAILTAARSGEARGATWSEIDLDGARWTVPASRMKVPKEHLVPLSPACISLLKALPRMAGTDYVFPAPRGGELSDMAMTAVLRRMKVDAVPHGFRSTFRDWASERTNYPRDVAEMALAHSIGDKVEAAYRRGDLFQKRTRMMADWTTFCAKVGTRSATIVPMQRSA